MIDPPPMPVVVVAMRQADLPVPHVPSVTGRCSSCGEAVWLSKASERDLLARPGSSVVCHVCALAELATDDEHEVGVSDAVRAELEAYNRQIARDLEHGRMIPRRA